MPIPVLSKAEWTCLVSIVRQTAFQTTVTNTGYPLERCADCEKSRPLLVRNSVIRSADARFHVEWIGDGRHVRNERLNDSFPSNHRDTRSHRSRFNIK